MNKLGLVKAIFQLSLIMAVFLPFGYVIKSFFEPAGWFWYSHYYPWLTFAVDEAIFIMLAGYFYQEKRKLEQLRSFESA